MHFTKYSFPFIELYNLLISFFETSIAYSLLKYNGLYDDSLVLIKLSHFDDIFFSIYDKVSFFTSLSFLVLFKWHD